jgi:sugar-specific transcriptional regulator TrmB
MTDNDEFEFITRLKYFGLNDKEARLYYHLLKFGAKPPAVIARYMHTYREDVHRTLNSLLAKGVIVKSVSAPTVYVAMPPETVIDSVILRQKFEQLELPKRKQEVMELAEEIMAGDTAPEVEGCSYRVLRGPNEMNAISLKLMSQATADISVLMSGAALPIFHLIGILDMVPDAARRGVRMRLLTDVSHANLEAARYALERGVELRHAEPSGGIQFAIHDALKSVVLIRFNLIRGVRDTSVVAFFCESPVYARNLTYHLDLAWEQAVDGAERIQALEESS